MKTGKFFASATSIILSVSLAFSYPASAFAEESTSANILQDFVSSVFPKAELNANTGSKLGHDTTLSDSSTLSTKFDLRDPNGDGNRSDSLVTNVKEQNPWGTCWGFSSIAASETSILARATEEGKTIENLDLSELHLANSVYKNGGAPENIVGSAQAGEGYRNETSDPNRHLNGGTQMYASNVFACGIGPVSEKSAPYKSKEGTFEYVYILKSDVSGTKRTTAVANEDELAALKLQSVEGSVKPVWYAGNYTDANGNMVYTDWTTSGDLWNTQSYEFENSNVLPETRKLATDAEGKTVYAGLDMDAVKAIKSELQLSKRAVTCTYNTSPSNYNHENWTYFNDTYSPQNHGVTIVGWDDTISADSFGGITGNGKKPEGDGAWLIKNSWGAKVDQNGNATEFQNAQDAYDFGIEENGKNTGYFWLSYYDRTLTTFESFDFDLQTTNQSDHYLMEQYDFLPAGMYPTISTDEKSSTANVYTAESDMSLRTIGFTTFVPNTTLTCEVYLMDEEATSPTESGHSKLVTTAQETYDYAGYHRMTFSEEKWIAMRKDQRYAIVVTQKCNTDGKWYQGVAIQQGKPTDVMVIYYKYSTAVPTQINIHANTEGAKLIQQYMQAGMSKDDALAKVQSEMAAKYDPIESYYKEEVAPLVKAGKTETEAKAEAKAKYPTIDTQECESIEKDSETAVTEYSQVYWVAKVNEGESFIRSTAVSAWQKEKDSILSADDADSSLADDTWTDWTTIADTVNADKGVVCDNMPIKSLSESKSWATVAELTNLDLAIDRAKQALENDAVSEDGTDVDASQMWMTQSQKDELTSAVTSAEQVLALAGDNYQSTLANTTPTSETVNTTTATLNYTESGGMAASAYADDGTGDMPLTGDSTQDMMFAILLATMASLFFMYATTRQKATVATARHSAGQVGRHARS